MSQLQLLTSSANKLAEFQAILPEIEQLDIDLPEIQSLDPKEVIEAKLQGASAHHAGPFLVEDVSLTIHSLQGLPGPLIKWFMKTVGNYGIYQMTASFGKFEAEAVTMLGYMDLGGDIHYFEGRIPGRIVEPRGESGFGWDPIFEPQGHTRTFAEMNKTEKNEVSMRRLAIEAFKTYLERG